MRHTISPALSIALLGLASLASAETFTYPDYNVDPVVSDWNATAGIAAGDTVILNSNATASSTTSPITNNGALEINATQNNTFNNAFNFGLSMSGSGSVGVTAGIVSLTGTNNYTGGTTISNGSLYGTPSSLRGNFAVTGELGIWDPNDGNVSGTFTGSLSGEGIFRILTNGTVTWTGGNTMGSFARIRVETGRLVGTTANLKGEIENGATVQFNQTSSGTFTGRFFDPGAFPTALGTVVKTGTGDMTWTSNNRSTQGNSGTLSIEQGRLIGPAQSMDVNGTVTIAAGAEMRIVEPVGAFVYQMITTIEGNGAVVKAGAGTVDLAQVQSRYSSLTTVEAGKLVYQASSMPQNPNTGTFGEIRMTGSGTSNSTGISIYSGGQINVEIDVPNLLTGNGSVTVSGNSKLLLSGSNTYGGGTFVENGHVIGTTTTIPGAVTLNGNANVEYRQNTNATMSQAIVGDGAIIKSGSGKLTLAPVAGNLTGVISVEGGSLAVNRSLPDVSTAYVKNGSTLMGSGTIGSNQPFFVGIDVWEGTLSPGNSAGIITTNDLEMDGTNTAITWELMTNTAAAGDRGTSYDGINLTNGNLTIQNGAALNLVFNAAGSNTNWFNQLWDSNQSWVLIDNVVNPTLTQEIFSQFNIGLDAAGGSLGTLRPGAGFTTALSGGDVVINYTAAALVPEPSTLALAAIAGLGGLLAAVRRRAATAR